MTDIELLNAEKILTLLENGDLSEIEELAEDESGEVGQFKTTQQVCLFLVVTMISVIILLNFLFS